MGEDQGDGGGAPGFVVPPSLLHRIGKQVAVAQERFAKRKIWAAAAAARLTPESTAKALEAAALPVDADTYAELLPLCAEEWGVLDQASPTNILLGLAAVHWWGVHEVCAGLAALTPQDGGKPGATPAAPAGGASVPASTVPPAAESLGQG
jgi:hypothetical protein